MIEVKNVYKSYYKNQVLKDVSLTVASGEIHGLRGENGAGKTTLIKCMTGIYDTDKGSVTYDGKAVYDVPEVKARIGYVADYNDYIGYFSVAIMRKVYQSFYPKFDKTQFDSLNTVLKVPLGTTVRSLSKGQKMRLAFMLELSKQPEYLIMDEPTSGLDPVAKAEFYELLIREVEEKNIAVLISSHNLEGLERICDTVTLLHEGCVSEQAGLDTMKEGLVKLQAVFENGAGVALSDMPQILSKSNVGSIYTLLVSEYSDSLLETLKKAGAGFVEVIPLTLEEYFIARQTMQDVQTAAETR